MEYLAKDTTLLLRHERKYIRPRHHSVWPRRQDPDIGVMVSSKKIGIRYAVNRKDSESAIVNCDALYEPNRGIGKQQIGGNYVKKWFFDKEP